jgi:hypothetical protein
MPGRFIVTNDQRVVIIDDQLNDEERRFAQNSDGELDPHFALEAAIDLLSRAEQPNTPVDMPARSLIDWLFPKRLTPLRGTP